MTGLIQHGTFRFANAQLDQDCTGVYHYTDEFFRGDARRLDVHLRTMSMVHALACFPSAEAEDISASCQNAEALLGEIGFTDLVVNDDYRKRGEEDTLGILAAHKIIEADGAPVSIVTLGLRGADYGDEWAINIMLGEAGPAHGFQVGCDKLDAFLQTYLDQIRDRLCSRVKYWITGYSRVAAIVNLFGARISRDPASYRTRPEDVYLYTFESPAAAPAREEITFIHNTVNPHDLVPMLAPSAWGFCRYGRDDTVFPKIDSDAFRACIPEVKRRLAEMNPRLPYDPHGFVPHALVGSDIRPVPESWMRQGRRPGEAWWPSGHMDDYLMEMMRFFGCAGLTCADQTNATDEDRRRAFVREVQDSAAWTAEFFLGAPLSEQERMRRNIEHMIDDDLGQGGRLWLYLNLLGGREGNLRNIEKLFRKKLRRRILRDSDSPLDDAGITRLFAQVRPLVHFFVRVMSVDAKQHHFSYLPTLAKNLDEIVTAHQAEVNFAWVQTLDEWHR